MVSNGLLFIRSIDPSVINFGSLSTHELNLNPFPEVSETRENWPLTPHLLHFEEKIWFLSNVEVCHIIVERTHQSRLYVMGRWFQELRGDCLWFWSHSTRFLRSACRGLGWHFLIPLRATSLIATSPQLCSDTKRSAVSVDVDKIIWWHRVFITLLLWVKALGLKPSSLEDRTGS